MNKGKKPLSETHPELAKEAHGWDPSLFTAGSNSKVNWKCSKGHVWEAIVGNRSKGQGCGVCDNKKVLTGFNDLATTHPELAKEAHGWDPKKVIAGTHRKLKWKCSKGHVWEAMVVSRIGVRKTVCPICSNRIAIEGFNDLATTQPELAKEADGWDPKKVTAGTQRKLKWKCSKGHVWEAIVANRSKGVGCPICDNKKVLTGFNDLATTHPELAKEAFGWDPSQVISGLNKRVKWKCIAGHVYEIQISNRKLGSNCPICVNQKLLTGFNDLATTHPELAKEAHGWDPKKVIANANKKLDWTCSNKHIWAASIKSRKLGNNCPICSHQKLLTGFNDLATTHPELAKEAYGWDPSQVISGSHVEWKCKKDHVWKTTIRNRKKGRDCPSCAKFGFDPNENGYLYFLIHPKWELFQIGITNFPEDRLKTHQKTGFELLELRGPMDGHTAQELELSLLRYLKNQKADLSPDHVAGKFDGFSESWTIDSFQINSLKELIDKASEAGY